MLDEKIELLSEACPLCGAPVSESRFAQLQERVRAEEREKLERATQAMRLHLDQEHRNEIDRLRETLSQTEQKLLNEHMRDLDSQRATHERELAELGNRLRNESAEREQQAVQETLARSAELARQLEGTRTRAEEAERRAADEMSAVRAAHTQELLEARARATEDATLAAQSSLAEARANAERLAAELTVAQLKQSAAADLHKTELEAALSSERASHEEDIRLVRTALEKDRDDQLRLLNQQRLGDQETWKKKVEDLKRSLEKKTAHELGEWPEVDIYSKLKDTFPEDRVRRVDKGEEGADVIFEVRHNGALCGSVVVDSKNRKAWQNKFSQKLREDRDAARADHAVLATSAFPQGERDLCIRDECLVVRPHAVVTVMSVLREFIVRAHIQGLSKQQKDAKAVRLYEYFNSGQFSRSLALAGGIGEQLEQIDVEEHKTHEKIWERRGTLHRKLTSTVATIRTSIDSIVEGDSAKSKSAS